MERVSQEQLQEAIQGFAFEGIIVNAKPHGNGHINATFLQ